MTQEAPSSSITYKCSVFLSYCGKDTSQNFTNLLQQSLCRKGLRVRIRLEEDINSTLFKAIHESRIAIIVFSKKYANSAYCLQELVQILECFKEEDRLIYPVFYDIDPSDVRHQTGSYAEALDHPPEKIYICEQYDGKKRRPSLSQAAGYSFGSKGQYDVEKRRPSLSQAAGYSFGPKGQYDVEKRRPSLSQAAGHSFRLKWRHDVEKWREWRAALSQVADRKGYYFRPTTMDVHECIGAIVERVTAWMNEKEEEEEEHNDTVMPRGTLSSSITYKGPYHVFLSYCVEDRFYFTDLLRLCLLEEELPVFVRKGIRPDEDITSTLFKAIHESRIAIIIFSKKYANSEICLQELVQILESFKEEGRLIFPVYCDVDPSEAWARLEERFKDKRNHVEKWRLALSQDYHSLTKTTDIREGVRAIVERVSAWISEKEKEEEEHDDPKKKKGRGRRRT